MSGRWWIPADCANFGGAVGGARVAASDEVLQKSLSIFGKSSVNVNMTLEEGVGSVQEGGIIRGTRRVLYVKASALRVNDRSVHF